MAISALRLEKKHYDKATKLEQIIDYWDCNSCLEFREEILECPKCSGRSCLPCLIGFSQKDYAKDPTLKTRGITKCCLCSDLNVPRPPHKFLK